MKLIDDWKSAYKKFSVQALAAIAAAHSIAALYPNVMTHHVPFLTNVTWSDGLSMATTAVAALGIVGRLILQEEPAP